MLPFPSSSFQLFYAILLLPSPPTPHFLIWPQGSPFTPIFTWRWETQWLYTVDSQERSVYTLLKGVCPEAPCSGTEIGSPPADPFSVAAGCCLHPSWGSSTLQLPCHSPGKPEGSRRRIHVLSTNHFTWILQRDIAKFLDHVLGKAMSWELPTLSGSSLLLPSALGRGLLPWCPSLNSPPASPLLSGKQGKTRKLV